MDSFLRLYLISTLLMGAASKLQNCGFFDDTLPEAMKRVYDALKDGVKLGPHAAIAHTSNAVADRSQFQCDADTNEMREAQIMLRDLTVGIGPNKLKEAKFEVSITFNLQNWGKSKQVKVGFLNWGDPMCGTKKCGKNDVDVQEFGKSLTKEKAESNLEIMLLKTDWTNIAEPNKYTDKPTTTQVEIADKVAAAFKQRMSYGQDPEVFISGFEKSELMIRYTTGDSGAVLVRTPDDTKRITVDCKDQAPFGGLDLHTEYQFFVIVHAKDKSVKVGIRNSGTTQNIKTEILKKCTLNRLDEHVTRIVKTLIQGKLT